MMSLGFGWLDENFQAHHSEPGDPTLLQWIKATIDHLFGFEPLVVAGILTSLIIVPPMLSLVLFLSLRIGRRSSKFRQDSTE